MPERNRGRRNTNERGSAKDRRARKLWLLSEAAGFGGDGQMVPCHECATPVDFQGLHVDRSPISGEDGGTYARTNIAPHCGGCSCRQGQRRTTALRNQRRKDAECNRAS